MGGEFTLILSIIINIVLLVLIIFINGRQGQKFDGLERELKGIGTQFSMIEKNTDKIGQAVKEEIARNREESALSLRSNREEMSYSLKSFGDSLLTRIAEAMQLQQNQSANLADQMNQLMLINENKLESMRQTVEEKLRLIQEDNNNKLEQMRATVDEKLNTTLEKRLGESFRLVSERLEQVHKSLGEMQSLAAGVGDLKKVLTNIKTRGIWGEIQLGNILAQLLTSEQYYTNVQIKKDSQERVEFAIRLPGQNPEGTEVLLPIDAKFPQEDYQRYVEACESGNPHAAEEAAKQLENRIKSEAKRICEKYICPPHTTDFGIMFLPTESLYAEVVRRPGLIEHLQEKYRVNVSGPATMAAFLNSLSMGFKTLAIQKRSSEVWTLLGAVKTEFGKFGTVLEKTHKKLQEASNTIDEAARRSRAIERKLREVEELPTEQAQELIGEIASGAE